MCDIPTIEPHEIIGIINYSWSKSFGKVGANKKAISDRGWYPYNRNLMIGPSTRASVTKEEARNEVLATSTIILPTKAKEHSIFICNNQQPTFDPTYIENPVNEEIKEVNFATGMAEWCLDTIVQRHDPNEARI